MKNLLATLLALTLGASAFAAHVDNPSTGSGGAGLTPAQEALLNSAWQNPASATNWTWTSDGTQITLTGYTGPNDVVIPDMLDNLPVTGFGAIFKTATVTRITGGLYVTNILDNSFAFNTNIISISFPSVVTIGGSLFTGAFRGCGRLQTINLPNATTFQRNSFSDCTSLVSVAIGSATNIGEVAFDGCVNLVTIRFPSAVTAVGNSAFNGCSSLTGVYWGDAAPAEAPNVYEAAPNVTNYVTNPTATGWGATWNGRPVVRLPVYADNFYGSGTGITGITAAQVGAVATNDTKYLSAWQNPASATNWTWTSDGTQITLTGYTGPNDVVIPDMLDGLPVTTVGMRFKPGLNPGTITSISGGANVTRVGDVAFGGCPSLTSVNLPAATSLGKSAFSSCPSLASVSLPAATSIGDLAFYDCTSLTSVSLPAATIVGEYAFYAGSALTSVYFGQNAPAEATDVYDSTPNVTNYVTNPTATGWGSTWNGRPVVRLPVYADTVTCKTQYLYYASATNCAGIWMDADKQYVFKIKAGVYSALTNAIP